MVGGEKIRPADPTASGQRAAGVRTKLEVWPEMIHVWQLFASFLPEGQQAIDGIGKFIIAQTN